MPDDRIEKHPSVIFHGDLAEICAPLKKLNISYFAHVNINNYECSGLTNHPDFHRHYLKNSYFDGDIELANNKFVTDFVIWDLFPLSNRDSQVLVEATEFGINHIFTIIEKYKENTNLYYFATKLQNEIINQAYLNNLDLLKVFIMYFQNCINTNSSLKSAYDIKFSFDELQNQNFEIINNELMAIDRNQFIENLINHQQIVLRNNKILSSKQLSILYWLHNGKTINDIAKILNIADITVNKYIADIKEKSGCYTQFQLGQLFEKLNAYFKTYHQK